jgi:hypothetical protein
MARPLEPRLVRAYADFWADHGISHQLTLSLGFHPGRYQPEEFLAVMKRLVRETARRVRGIPKRKAERLTIDHPRAPFFAGFYEGTDRAGLLYPHWHGGIALRPGEEPTFRAMLWECFGEDAKDPLQPFEPSRTTRPLVTERRANPTFDLTKLTTTERYIRYSTKHVGADNLIHWTTADFLA